MTDEVTVVEPLMLPAEAAKVLAVAPAWLYRAARDGHIPCVRLGRNVRFRPEEIAAIRARGVDFEEE